MITAQGGNGTYDLAVEEVLANHDGVDRRGVLEREERETARAARGVAHDRARLDLAKLCKVLSQRLCSNHRLALLRAEKQAYVPSVVSQFSPPINILLYNNRQVADTREGGYMERKRCY